MPLSLTPDGYSSAVPLPFVNLPASVSPKRPALETEGLSDIFPYYAGFSFSFALEELSRFTDAADQVLVADPWNGSGTTTRAAQQLGLISVGVDLNPAANVIAAFRCLLRRDGLNPSSLFASLGRDYLPTANCEDPLRFWFTEDSVAHLRKSVNRLFRESITAELGLTTLIALFRLVRVCSERFQGSNPTWVRRATRREDLLNLPATFDAMLAKEVESIGARLRKDQLLRVTPASIRTASVRDLPIEDDSVTAFLTSPPYLTRIDYAISFARELALLGVDVWSGSIRRNLMGTTLTRRTQVTEASFGDPARCLIESISSHESKASTSYYTKQARQYLDDLCVGLDEITRVGKSGAFLTMVVQDSYYKDVHVALSDICISEASLRSWSVIATTPFRVRRSLVDLNARAQAYKKGAVSETVIRLRLEK